MSSRKRPLAEISQAHNTPSRYAPSTPHALRAFQQQQLQRSVNRSRPESAHSDRSVVRPDSARGILRRLARITAPTTKRRVVTPVVRKYNIDKENLPPEDEDDVQLEKPGLNFNIEQSIEEEDSEIPVAPTPSALLEDDDNLSDEDDEPTETFHNFKKLGKNDRRSILSMPPVLMSEPDLLDAENVDGNEPEETTFLSERGRRAVTEEATGRLSRYSFGSIRFSDFGPELEIRRESDSHAQKVPDTDAFFDNGNVSLDLEGATEDLRSLRRQTSIEMSRQDSPEVPNLGDETFELDVPDVTESLATRQAQAKHMSADDQMAAVDGGRVVARSEEASDRVDVGSNNPSSSASIRRQTLLESAVAAVRSKPRKRVKMTRHGHVVPSLPSSLIRRIVQQSADLGGRRRPVLGKDHMKALEQATEWFFEQLGDDLAAYSSHGKRKKRIDVEDVLLLMKRQRVVSGEGDLTQLAKEWLPKELRQSLAVPDSL